MRALSIAAVLIPGAGLMAFALWLFGRWIARTRRRQGQAFEGELARDLAAPPSRQEVKEAIQELGARWDEALSELKQAGLSVHTLPWYLLIGEPQSGKSTSLEASGLEFPVGQGSLSGAGGTRNCDWWFANEAVILDTAGRFTFQEDSAPDREEWRSFLKLLRRHRPGCPINGVIVVVPCSSLLADEPEVQRSKAENVRQKLVHLQRSLGIRFPVFMVFTKADQVLGFAELFGKLDALQQRQLLGWSNPAGPDAPFDAAQVDASLDGLWDAVHRLRLRLASEEEALEVQDRLFVFPEELAALREPVLTYIQTVFQRTRYDDPLLMRGYYFTSALQQGRPVARALREMLGEGSEVLEDLDQLFSRSRAFFIRDLFEKKVFAEQGLVRPTRAAERSRRRAEWGFRAAVVGLAAVLALAAFPAYRSLRGVLAPIDEAVAQSRACLEAPACPVPRAYALAQSLAEGRQRLARHRVLLAIFLKGRQAGELGELLGKVERRVFLAGVVAPLRAEEAARMEPGAASDGQAPAPVPPYPAFFASLEERLGWWAAGEGAAVVPPQELRIDALLAYLRATRGRETTARSREIDDWLGSSGAAGGPTAAFEGIRGGLRQVDLGGLGAFDPASGLRAFEAYWTVETLARDAIERNRMLQRLQAAYGRLLEGDATWSAASLARVTGDGRQFEQLFAEITRALAETGAGVDAQGALASWRQALQADHGRLQRFAGAAPAVGQELLRRILGRLEAGAARLQAEGAAHAHLVVPDGRGRLRWTAGAQSTAAVVSATAHYADLGADAEERRRAAAEAVAKPTAEEGLKLIQAFGVRESERKDAALQALAGLDGLAADAAVPLRAAALSRLARRTAAASLALRVLPEARAFFDQALGPGCPVAACGQAIAARQMVPAAARFLVLADDPAVRGPGSEGEQEAQGLAQTVLAYVARFAVRGSVVQASAVLNPPTEPLAAPDWPAFQAAVARWSAASEYVVNGSGTEEPAVLSAADRSAFAATHWRLQGLRDGGGPGHGARTGGVPARAAIQAAARFKRLVASLPATPRDAWQRLSRGVQGASLEAYHAFSRDPAVRSLPEGRVLQALETHGAHLLRDALRPRFTAAVSAAVPRLKDELLGSFPFVSESRLQEERRRYEARAALSTAVEGGAAVWKLDLPTVEPAQLETALAGLSAILDDYAADPLLAGREPDFDFVPEDQKHFLRVARAWERFLFAPAGAGARSLRSHAVTVRSLGTVGRTGGRFLGDRLGLLQLFDAQTVVRPSTDAATGRQPPTFVWRPSSAQVPLSVVGRNEDTGRRGWSGRLEIDGGALRFFYFVQLAAVTRTAPRPWAPAREGRTWLVLIQLPDGERPQEALEGLFELQFEEPLPGVLAG